MTHRIVLVGCGRAKRDRELEPGRLRVRRYPARDLYTSTYFSLKREYAEVVGDEWAVLSAEHGLVFPWEEIEPYDTAIGDLDGDALDSWVSSVVGDLQDWIWWEVSDGGDEFLVDLLAGRGYVDPLRGQLGLQDIDARCHVRFPFDWTGGIGDQMQWLSEMVACAEQPA